MKNCTKITPNQKYSRTRTTTTSPSAKRARKEKPAARKNNEVAKRRSDVRTNPKKSWILSRRKKNVTIPTIPLRNEDVKRRKRRKSRKFLLDNNRSLLRHRLRMIPPCQRSRKFARLLIWLTCPSNIRIVISRTSSLTKCSSSMFGQFCRRKTPGSQCQN